MQDAVSRYDIRNITVILAGSRTGSSFLFNALASQGEYICPTGEETVFYRQAGLGLFKKNYDDSLEFPESPEILDRIFNFMKCDIGLRAPKIVSTNDLFSHFWRRLLLQWPNIEHNSYREVAFSTLEKAYADSASPNDWSSMYLHWVRLLEVRGFPLDYQFFSSQGEHPLDLPLLEEPPYVTPISNIPLHQTMAHTHTLLLKTSTNVYRLPFLKALFPNAQFRWVVLKRNPAATINALMDGWLSTAFHSHDVSSETKLDIQGYSSVVPEGHRFWKFDMPPGWKKWIHAPLEDVCAFQWYSAYDHIGKFISTTNDPVMTVAYEEFLQNPNIDSILHRIFEFSNVPQKSFSQWSPESHIASVQPPRAGKWKDRQEQILPAIERQQDILKLAQAYSYDSQARLLWP